MHHSHQNNNSTSNGHAAAVYRAGSQQSAVSSPANGGQHAASSSASTVALASSEAETSFTSPHRLSQMLGGLRQSEEDELFRERRTLQPMVTSLSEESFSDEEGSLPPPPRLPPKGMAVPSSREGSSLDVYTDEPSVLSWKRRRQSEEVL